MSSPTLLVVAKAPVAGLAKTRIGRMIGDDAAAALAAAALLDTLETAVSVGWPVVVAMTGELDDATRSTEVRALLDGTRVVEQRGEGFGERLAHAHADADAGHGVVQVGMDSPHVTAEDYRQAGVHVACGSRVIGPAEDGGWWLLGLASPSPAAALVDVPMSRHDTGDLTELALGGSFARLRPLQDMDSWGDAVSIARLIPDSHLARAVQRLEARV